MNTSDKEKEERRKIHEFRAPKSYSGIRKVTQLDDKSQKPSPEEEEYFKKLEMERLRKQKEAREALTEAEETEQAQKSCLGRCPKCHGELKEVYFKKKVKIDRCQKCGGVWLDPGELEVLAGREEKFLSSFFQHFT